MQVIGLMAGSCDNAFLQSAEVEVIKYAVFASLAKWLHVHLTSPHMWVLLNSLQINFVISLSSFFLVMLNTQAIH